MANLPHHPFDSAWEDVTAALGLSEGERYSAQATVGTFEYVWRATADGAPADSVRGNYLYSGDPPYVDTHPSDEKLYGRSGGGVGTGILVMGQQE